MSEGVIEPETHGFTRAPKEAILGGEAEENAAITRAILGGQERGPKRDIVLLNGAYALFADGRARDIPEAIEILTDTIESGKAAKHLEEIVRISNAL